MGTQHDMIAGPGEVFTLAASAARTQSANGSAIAVGHRRRFMILCSITASATDAGDTLDAYVDVSPDGGTTWLNAVHFTQQAGNGAARKEIAILDPSNPGTAVVNVTSDASAGVVRPAAFGSFMRARWAIADSGDGNSSHTFSVTAYGV